MATCGFAEDENIRMRVTTLLLACLFFSLRLYCGPSGWRLTRCMRETAKWSVDNEIGSLESMGSSVESRA